ncbi:MAG: sugar phosphate nucleotidyltransferase [Candidatus Sumerlaeota bacterium]|nr:sugar phosphate nucleotidyltransferase [Candidatus Sumerlaeota bacterium]
MKAIIPAAGIGTRLRPHTYTAPKVLLSVAGKPILGHIIDELVRIGIDEMSFIIGYMGGMVRDYVRGSYSFKANFIDQAEMLGLGHAVSLGKPYHYADEPVLIILGDTIFGADLESVFARGNSSIGVKGVEDARRFGIVELDANGNVTRMIEKPEQPPTNLAIVGLYYITHPKLLFDCLDDNISNKRKTKGEYQLTDALQLMLDRGERMTTFMIDGWYDCGKAETMLLTNREVLDMKDGAAGGGEAWLAARYPGSVIRMPVAIHESAKIERSLVGPHVSIGAKSSIHSSIVRESIIGDHSDVSNAVLEESIIGNHVKVRGHMARLNVGDMCEVVLE